MAEKIYPKGIRVFKPREGAPDWVLGTVLVTPHELQEWIAANQQYMGEYQGNPQLKLDLLKGKDGPYIAVNTFKPEAKGSSKGEDTGRGYPPATDEAIEELPF